MKDVLLFDLDGTLLDTLGDLAAGVNSALAGLSFASRTRDEVRSFIGNGVPTLMRRSLPAGTDDGVFAEALARFTAYYMAHMADTTVPYAGIPEALARLRGLGYRIGVVSNKKDEAVKKLCDKLLPGLCDYAAGARNEEERKPRPDMVYAALGFFGVPETSAVYIGDSDTDIKTAANAGVRCVSVLWGYRGKDELTAAGGKYFAETPSALAEMILTLDA